MVIVNYNGRLGNQLFQYTYARLLSEIVGHEFLAPPIPEFPNLVVQCKGGGLNAKDKILINGYFEDAGLYARVREKIVKWFRFEERPISVAECAIHIRGTDAFKEGSRCPPLEYYQKAIDVSGAHSFTIYTEDLKNEVVTAVRREFDCSVVSGLPVEDMYALSRHSQIIIGNSTFAWWSAFLSGHNNIIQCCPRKGWRSREEPGSCLQIDEWKRIEYDP